jgi:hypothetical protein
MATRSSALQRALNYFRSADVDEVRVAFTLAKEIVERRLAMVPRATEARQPKQRTRKTKVGPPGSVGGLANLSAQRETLGDA